MDEIFDTDELPNYKIYEIAQKVVADYMKAKNCKINPVAAELETTVGVLYRQLNPKDLTMPLNIDRIIAITRLTKDNAIIEAIAKEFDLNIIENLKVQESNADINLSVDIANMDNSEVFKDVKLAIEDNIITKKEKKTILSDIEKAQKANAQLKSRILSVVTKD